MSFDRAAYSRVGKSLVQKHQQHLDTQLEVLRQALVNFASEHASDIAASPEFTAKFTQMCVLAGLDPLKLMLLRRLSSSSQEPLAVAVRVMEFCQQTIHINGGLIAVSDLATQLLDADIGLTVTEAEVVKAVDALQKLGPGYSLITINSQRWLKYSSATDDMLSDQHKLLELCQFMGGYVTYRLLRDNYGWDGERCRRVVDEMILQALLWIDNGPPNSTELLFWVPTNLG